MFEDMKLFISHNTKTKKNVLLTLPPTPVGYKDVLLKNFFDMLIALFQILTPAGIP